MLPMSWHTEIGVPKFGFKICQSCPSRFDCIFVYTNAFIGMSESKVMPKMQLKSYRLRRGRRSSGLYKCVKKGSEKEIIDRVNELFLDRIKEVVNAYS